MKKIVISGLATALLAVPMITLAQTGINVGLDANANANAQLNTTGVDVEAQGHANVDVNNDGINDNNGKPIPTLYGNSEANAQGEGKMLGHDKDSAAADTEVSGEAQGWGKGGIVGFFRTMLGLDSSAKMKDIRAGMEAKASTTAGVDSKSKGLGFWGKIWGLFSFKAKSETQVEAQVQ